MTLLATAPLEVRDLRYFETVRSNTPKQGRALKRRGQPVAPTRPHGWLAPRQRGGFAAKVQRGEHEASLLASRSRCAHRPSEARVTTEPHSLRHVLHLAEQEIEAHLARIFKEREERELAREPSLAQIPRILLRKPPTQAQSSLPQQELGRQARARLREKMSNLVLQHMELEQMWGLLKRHASPPHQPTDERINWDDFSQIAEAMPQRAAESYFSAKHFVLFDLDAYGRIPIVHFFQWAMRKNELMRTRAELELYDSGGDGWLTENDLQQYVEDLL